MRDDGGNLGSSSMPAATSVLAGSGAGDLATSPFCHLASHNALPPDYYDTLQQLFPDDQAILRGRRDDIGNAVARLLSTDIMGNPVIAPAWQEFVAFHTSDAFWVDIVRVFGTALRQAHPEAERKVGKRFEDWHTTRPEAYDLAIRCRASAHDTLCRQYAHCVREHALCRSRRITAVGSARYTALHQFHRRGAVQAVQHAANGIHRPFPSSPTITARRFTKNPRG